MQKVFKRALVVVLVGGLFLLMGCSGSGGSDFPSPPVQKKSQSISFAQAGPLTKTVHTTFSNVASGGSGTGAISYACSDTSVATVSATTGLVTPLESGTVTITATKAEDATYKAATAAYELNVVVKDYPFTGWVSGTTTQHSWFLFDSVANGKTLITSTNVNCNPSANSNCDNRQDVDLDGAWVDDTYTRLTTTSWFWLKEGSSTYSQPTKVTIDTLTARAYHGATIYNGKAWVLGGRTGTTLLKDVWNTTDGLVWEKVADNPTTGLLYRHQLVAFDDKLWCIGGKTGTNLADVTASVKVSTDGVTWTDYTDLPGKREGHRVALIDNKLWVVGGRDETGAYQKSVYYIGEGADAGTPWTAQALTDIGFSPRADFSLVMFGDRLWVSGGIGSGGIVSDLWSFDGTGSWYLETPDAFGGRTGHKMAVVGSTLYLVGGNTGTSTLNDVWTTTDGTSWTKVSSASPYSKRQAFELLCKDNRLWVVGGGTVIGSDLSKLQSDLWTSVDGVAWNQVTLESSISGRSAHESVVFQGQIWTIGGKDETGDPLGDIWSSVDGIQWDIRKFEAPFAPRYGHDVIVHANKLWVIGGRSSSGRLNDVWSSEDGISWQQHDIPSGGTRFSERSDHQIASFDNKLWVIGGDTGSGLKDDIWNSTDGTTWTRVVDAAPFSARSGHEVLVFKNTLWVIGGSSANDVWKSTNGVDWTETATNIFTGTETRNGFSAAYLGTNMYITCGDIGSNTYNTKVFASTDGAIWNSITDVLVEQPDFDGRKSATLVVFEDRLHLMCGSTGNRFLHDVWRSEDGRSWLKGYQNVVRFNP